MSDRLKLTFVLLAALLQGLTHLWLLPPWQHYDEPTHFEYAWLIARNGHLPRPGDETNELRRPVAESMLRHNFYSNLPKPDLRSPLIPIGISELVHPPLYYLLLGLALRPALRLDVTVQLYVARTLSLSFFLLTVLISAGMMRELVPKGHTLRWAIPATVALLPPVADLMTAVNNDAGAIVLFSAFLWSAIRIIHLGLNWKRLLSLGVICLLAALTKNTAVVAIVLVPIVALIALRCKYAWRWRWLVIGSVSTVVLLLSMAVDWSDAASWYLWPQTPAQEAPSRVVDVNARVGPHVLLLETAYPEQYPQLRSAISALNVRRLAGRTVTVGGWIWANQPVVLRRPGLVLRQQGASSDQSLSQPLKVSKNPTFVAWTLTLPPRAEQLSFALFGHADGHPEKPLRVMLDGAILIDGTFPPSSVPQFDDTSAHSGTWAGQHFTNLLQNPSAEVAGLRLRPWFERVSIRYTHRSPLLVLIAFLDVERTWPFLIHTVAPFVVRGFFTGFAWGQVRLDGIGWRYLFYGLAILAAVGCITWFARSGTGSKSRIRPALVFLGLAGMIVWVNTIMRPLPMLDAQLALPAARYAFPSVIPTALVLAGGWWALWPRRYRAYGSLILLACLMVLNIVSIWTIWSFYQSLPVS